MKHWHEFDILITNTKEEAEADKLGLPEPEAKRTKVKIDLAMVGAYHGAFLMDGRETTIIETTFDSFQVLMPYEDFDTLIQGLNL